LNIVVIVLKGVCGIVNILDLEEAFAAVTTDEFLVAIEAYPFSAPVVHLG
jgi:hypothetical protein